MKQIGVLGPGGVGGFLAVQCERAGYEVTCVTHADPIAASRRGLGLKSVSCGDHQSFPRFVSTLDRPLDVLFITVKSPSLSDALSSIPAELVQDALVIPLLNGIEHLEICHERLRTPIVAGTISIEAFVASPGTIIHASPQARMELSSDDHRIRQRLFAATPEIQQAGIEVVIGLSESQVLWNKLARLCAIACTTAASQKTLGEVRADVAWRTLLHKALAEAIAVAQKDGAHIDFAKQVALMDALPETLRTSLQRDVAAGKANELDAIAGAVVRRGEREGVDCPTIRSLIHLINDR